MAKKTLSQDERMSRVLSGDKIAVFMFVIFQSILVVSSDLTMHEAPIGVLLLHIE